MRAHCLFVIFLCLFQFLAMGQAFQKVVGQEVLKPIAVSVEFNNDRWQLIRGGQPYFVKGAGGLGSLELLKKTGGNSNRIWGVDELTRKRLDQAHAHGISVAVGIWLEHATRGYDYQDYQQIVEQTEKVLSAVRQYKDHPAILLWGVGNEMEGYQSGDNPAIWLHVNDLCRQIKQLDPLHPTMTVIAEIGGNRIPAIHRFCPEVDIIGINSYGGAASLPKRYRDLGGTKPYLVTEFGPLGPWELGRDNINAVVEFPSHVKAEQYERSYLGFTADKTHCLGSYAFLWGQKMEATTTWFGMLLPDGRTTNMVDTMSELWTGQPLANQAPTISELKITDGNVVEIGDTLEFQTTINDPENQEISVEWILMPEADAYLTYGEFKPNPEPITDAFISSNHKTARINAPTKSGLYRMYVLASDPSGSTATASVAFKVKHQPLKLLAKKIDLPMVIYDEAKQLANRQALFSSVENLGSSEGTDLELNCGYLPKSGQTCLRFFSAAVDGEVGRRFYSAGGIDASGAQRIAFWAKGKRGGEQVTVGIGHPQSGTTSETLFKSKAILVTRHWKKFHIDFANADLRRIETGFWWSIESEAETELWFDQIRIE